MKESKDETKTDGKIVIKVMKTRINKKVINRWKIEYIALECFYLKPFARNVYLKRKAILFSSSMVVLAIGLWFYGIYWFYAFLFGVIIYPLAILSGIITFGIFSSWIGSRRDEAYRLLLSQPAFCPVCHFPLRTGLAKQCRNCFFDWH
jgi:hypothetical protein